jgi:hypothetical protein
MREFSDSGRRFVTVTIDTEEDDWGSYFPTHAGTRNIGKLPELQQIFDRWGVRPTLVVTYPTLEDSASVAVLGTFAERNGVEIGAHCHPWNTPPLASDVRHSMMSRLNADLNAKKLTVLTERIRFELGVSPRVFRAGRWGFGPSVAKPLCDLGYEIDASVTPFLNWSNMGGPDYSSAPHLPYRFWPTEPLRSAADGPMVELPTTVGFTVPWQRTAAGIRARLEHHAVWRRSGFVGALDRMGVLTRRWLSPELATTTEMIRVSEACIRGGQQLLAVTFQSPALFAGLTPFVRSTLDRERFIRRIDDYLRFCAESGFEFVTLSEAARLLKSGAITTSTPSAAPSQAPSSP